MEASCYFEARTKPAWLNHIWWPNSYNRWSIWPRVSFHYDESKVSCTYFKLKKKFKTFIYSDGRGEILEESFSTEVWDFETGRSRTIEPNLPNNANSAEVWEEIAIYFVGPSFCDPSLFVQASTMPTSTFMTRP